MSATWYRKFRLEIFPNILFSGLAQRVLLLVILLLGFVLYFDSYNLIFFVQFATFVKHLLQMDPIPIDGSYPFPVVAFDR